MASKTKTYVLLDHLRPSAPIFKQIGQKERLKIDTLEKWKPFLKVNFTKDGKNKVARFKMNSNTIWQDEQIKDGILANEPFTRAERNLPEFTNGVLVTNNETLQLYLESIPTMEGFVGYCDSIKRPAYKLFDKAENIKSENAAFKRTLAAANRVAAITNLEDAQALLIRINGSFFKSPNDLEECQNILIGYIDADDKDILNEILKDAVNVDDQNTILLGKLISAGILSFDAVEGQVAKKNGNGWLNLKAISNEYSPEERKRYFSEFLTTEAGLPLLDDLKKALEKPKEKPKEKALQT